MTGTGHRVTPGSRHTLVALAASLALLASGAAHGALAQGASAGDPGPTVQPTLTDAVDRALAARAERLGGDPLEVRAYVAATVALEEYAGALKGPRGAFLTGGGNSVDQALLVAELLRRGAPEVPLRFASCELPLADTQPTPDAAPPLAIDQVEGLQAAIADPAVASDLAEAVTQLVAYRARTRDRVAAAADDLERALVGGHWRSAAASRPTAGTTAHVWVQAGRDGGWMDLDPTTPTGAPPCAATETLDALPPSAWHTVRFRLSAERQSAGSLVETVVLDATQPTAELAAARITLGFGEPMGLVAPSGGADDPELAYTPLLRIDDTSIVGEPLRVVRAVVEGDGGGSLGGFDPFGGASEPEPAPEADPVTAVWLDIDLVAPSGEVRRLRSEVFDRLGIEARAAGTAGATAVRPLTLVAGAYGAFETTWHIGVLLGERRQPDGDDPAFLDLPSLDLTAVDGLAATMDALLRMYPALRRDLGGATNTPVVLLAGVSQVEGPPKRGGLAPGDVLTGVVLDALLVPAGAPPDAAAAARDAQASLAAEGVLVALMGGGRDPSADALGVFDAATAAGTPWLALAPGDTDRPDGASPAALARMEARLGEGFRLVTPSVVPSMGGSGMTAWWLVDPVSGVVRDENELGRHAPLAEYGGQNAQTTSRWQSFCNLAWGLRRGFVVAAVALYLGTGGVAGGGALKAVAKIAEQQQKNRKAGEEALKIGCPRQGSASGPPLP